MSGARGIGGRRRTDARDIGAAWRAVLFTAAASLWPGWPGAGVAEARSGTLVLVGDVLRFNQNEVWSRITQSAPELVVIAAANERPKLYGEFAQRALRRHGAFAELLPLAADFAEFGVDHRRAVADPNLIDRVHEASGVFFVGGAPQRLAGVLVGTDGSPTPLGSAVAEVHSTGGMVVGGIPGAAGLATGVDALEALAKGRVPSGQLFRGLGLAPEGWFIDQHAFSPGRLAEILVAMRQLGFARGIGIGPDTSAVMVGGEVEVLGDEGILLIDLGEGRSARDFPQGFRLDGARLSYLEQGDRFDMTTLEVTPAAAKLDGFELEHHPEDDGASDGGRAMTVDLFARGQLLRLLREALDGTRREAFAYAFPQGAGDDARGFRLRLHSVPGTAGWLSVDSGMERYTIVNIGLEIAGARRGDMAEP